jgi:DNA-binding transcriptional ArsR family regulator
VLANAVRLRVLRQLLDGPPRCVSDVAVRCGISAVNATQHLRLLQARGLLRAKPAGRWVRYTATPDPLVAHARPLLHALKPALCASDRHDPRDIINALTAFTHERRIRILRAIAGGVRTPLQLQTICRISPPAVTRHLRKLRRRNVVCRREERLCLAQPAHPLARALLALALACPTQNGRLPQHERCRARARRRVRCG